jgi:hypothetical protein
MSKTPKDPMVLRDAAREFGLNYMWLRKRIKDGDLPAIRVGKYVVVSRADVAKLATPEAKLLEQLMAARRKKKA